MSVSLIMQDIVFLIKGSLENSFYCESLNLCETININISRNKLVEKYTSEEIKEAFNELESLFSARVNCIINQKYINPLKLVNRISFSSEVIYFQTHQYFINRLYKVDFSLVKLIELPN